MRRHIGIASAVWFAAIAFVPAQIGAQQRELVVATWGDPYESVWRQTVIPVFEKKYNAKVIWVPGTSSATRAKVLAERANPQIDVAMLDDGPHQALVLAGVVEKLDRSKLTNSKDLLGIAYEPDDYGVGFGLDAVGLFYNTKIFADNKWNPPTSWLDLYRPEFKGKVLAHHISNGNGLCLLLALNRISGANEVSSIDAGFAKVKQLAPDVVTFDQYGQTPTLIQQTVAVVGPLTISRTTNLAESGAPVKFVYPKEGVCAFKQVATIVKGRPNRDLAYQFIDVMLSKEVQESTAKMLGMGPLNKTAKLDPDTTRRVLNAGDNASQVWVPNWPVVNANRSAWTERWSKEIEQR